MSCEQKNKLCNFFQFQSIILFLLLKLSYQKQQINIVHPFYVVTSKRLLITPVFVGSSKKEINLVIDIGVPHTWISEEIFSKKESSSFLFDEDDWKITFNHDEAVFKGAVCSDKFVIDKKDNKGINRFPFVLVQDIVNNTDYQGALSLGNNYDSKYDSFIFRISPNSNSFSLKFKSPFEGLLSIKESTNYVKTEDNVPSCNAHQQSINWGCKLTHIILGNYENIFKVSNTFSVFETIYYKIYVPMEFFNYWSIHAYDDKKKGNQIKECTVGYDDNFKEHYFKCPEKEIDYLKEINIVFDNNIILHLRNRMMYNSYGNNKIMMIVGKENLDHFVFGSIFLAQFETIFDYNRKEISFIVQYEKDRSSIFDKTYSNENRNTYNLNVLHFLIYLVIILTLIGLGLLSLQNYCHRLNLVDKNQRNHRKPKLIQ